MKRPAAISISDALLDQRLLGAALGDASTWRVWLCVLKAAFGLPLGREERKIFAAIAGDRAPPTRRVRELWCVAGRRGGKSRIAAALAVYAACFVRHKVSPGERLMCLVLSASVEQSKTVFGYALAFLRESPILRREIIDTTTNEIRLRNGVTIAVHANSFRSVRGRTLCACIFDEVSFWRDDSTAVPDREVYTAILPSLATTRGMLVAISSPYRKTGLLHAKHKAHFGVDGDDVLVMQGSSRTFNPSLDEEAIAAQRLADPTAAASEWDAEFRADLVGFLDDAIIDRAINRDGPLELPPQLGMHYEAFVDPSGGATGGDSYTITIVHKEKDGRLIVDVVRGHQGPFSVDDVTFEYAALCREYRIYRVVGDHYGAQWVAQAWQKTGVRYEKAELNASMLYLEALPLWTRGLVEIPDHPALVRELRLLERIPGRIGKDQVTHPRNVHDDLANATCGALALLSASQTIDWKRALEQAAMMPPNPKYAQHGGPSRYMQHGREQCWEQQLGERRYGQLRRGIIPGRRPEP